MSDIVDRIEECSDGSGEVSDQQRENKILSGVRDLLDAYLSIRDGDSCIVVYTPPCREYAAYLKIELDSRGISNDAVAMRPYSDLGLREELGRFLPDLARSPGKLCVITLEAEGITNSDVFEEIISEYGKSRVKLFRIISASDELFYYGLKSSPQEISQRNATLLELFRSENEIRVRNTAGTDVLIEFDHDRYDWVSVRGAWRPGVFTVLPAGELATYAKSVNGRIVADGAMRVNVVHTLDPRLEVNPISITVEDSLATHLECADDDLLELAQACFRRPHGNRVGELGFGTNAGCTTFAAHNSHLNERFPGLHIGFGSHNQPFEIVDYLTDIHLDVVTNDAEVELPRAGRTIRLSELAPRPGIIHPFMTRDNDLVGDCCSRGCLPTLQNGLLFNGATPS
ncbi:hypothetical protein OIE68_39945 [Nocardia vinacea]|uniref:hypothetical protein n=1 Tax=Nocardia vinacea TaxID=96468 RepID=UPI002E1456C9|nr:hypothetical protein OIE68_39945 [Nocardia vinacea]